MMTKDDRVHIAGIQKGRRFMLVRIFDSELTASGYVVTLKWFDGWRWETIGLGSWREVVAFLGKLERFDDYRIIVRERT